MLNHITIMGRLTRDPELRRTQSGKAVTNFTVAVDRDFGEKQTDFLDVVAWEKKAEFIERFFRKGSMIIVDGSLQSRRWEDKNGNKRVSFEIMANSIYFGEAKRDSSNTYDERDGEPAEMREAEDDGELPF